MAETLISVEVVYAVSGAPLRMRLDVPEDCTVMQAIEASGMALRLPLHVVDPSRLGVHGRKVAPDQRLRHGDRVEIYRPLQVDPMEARRQRAR